MDWFGVPGANSENIRVFGSGCPNITLTGSGPMYGPSLSVDPLGVLTWN